MDTQAIIKQLAGMLSGFPDLTQSPEATAKSYIEALEGIPGDCVSAAISAFLAGRVENYNPAFRPSPPQIATEARRIWNIDIDRQNRARKTQLQIEARPSKFTESEMAQRRAGVDRLIEKLNFSRGDKGMPPIFTELPQAQAIADLDAMSRNKSKRGSIPVSDSLRAKYQQI